VTRIAREQHGGGGIPTPLPHSRSINHHKSFLGDGQFEDFFARPHQG
jgi:hypothetical protein